MNDEIVVAGGGIGGLSAALGLARAGQEVMVLEHAPELGEIGGGIQIGLNAFHCFDYLGIGHEARGVAVYIDALRMMDAVDGTEIAKVMVDEAFRARFRNLCGQWSGERLNRSAVAGV